MFSFRLFFLVLIVLRSTPMFAEEAILFECPEKIKVKIFLSDNRIKIPELTVIRAFGITNFGRSAIVYGQGEYLGIASFDNTKREFPSEVEVKLSKKGMCPNLIMLRLEGSDRKWHAFHFANSSAPLIGKSFSACGEATSIVIERGHSSF